MTTAVDTVRDFYAAIAAGDTGKMVGLMAPDIEWISVVDFNIQDRGPEEVIKTVSVPLMQEWESFSPAPSEFLGRWLDGGFIRPLRLHTPGNPQTRRPCIRACMGHPGRENRAPSSVHRYFGARTSEAPLAPPVHLHDAPRFPSWMLPERSVRRRSAVVNGIANRIRATFWGQSINGATPTVWWEDQANRYQTGTRRSTLCGSSSGHVSESKDIGQRTGFSAERVIIYR